MNGPGMMMASALKMMGLEPDVVEKISQGLLVNLTLVVQQQRETMDRLEWVLRTSAALDESRFPSAWDEYLTKKAEAQNVSHHNGGGAEPPAIGSPSA